MKRLFRTCAALFALCLALAILCPTAGAAPEAFQLPRSATSGEVEGAVVNGHWVYWDGRDILSLPLEAKDAQPILLQADTIPFHVWDDRVMVYARPAEGKPYRSILLTPDGKGRTVIDKRQSEFYSPIGASGDVCFAQTGKIVRYTLHNNRSVSLGFNVNGGIIGMLDGKVAEVRWSREQVNLYTASGKRTTLCTMQSNLREAKLLGTTCIFVTSEQTGSYIVYPTGKLVKLSDTLLDTVSPWAFSPDYVFARAEGAPIADATGAVYSACLIGAEGIYPVAADTLTVQSDGAGHAVIPEVDPAKLIPIAQYPVVAKGK